MIGDDLEIATAAARLTLVDLLDRVESEPERDDELVDAVRQVREAFRSVEVIVEFRSYLADQIEREWYGWDEATA